MSEARASCHSAQAHTSWSLRVGVGCLLSAILLLVWKSALSGEFHFDDYGNIVNNREIKSIWPLDAILENGRPLGLYSFALNYHFSQLNTYGYLLTNLLIHLVNVLLLFTGIQLSYSILAQTITDRETTPLQGPHSRNAPLLVAAFAALAWGLHPLTTQAVTYIVQRYESLTCFGYLGAWCGLLLVLSGNRWGNLLILIAAWIGLLSKEVFATAPLVILLFDRLATGEWAPILRKRWLSYLLMLSPFVWFVPMMTRYFDTSRNASMGFGLKSISSWEYLRTQPEVILHYLKIVLWPEPLCLDYGWRVQHNPVIYFSLGSIIVLTLLTGFVCYFKGISNTGSKTSSNRSLSRGLTGWMILAFFLILSPTSSIVPIADLCFEHRMYLPSAIVLTGLTLLANQIRVKLENNSSRREVLRCGIILGALSCLMFLGWKTNLRNLDYRSPIVLWRTVLNVSPENPRAWFMLGNEYYERNQNEIALTYYLKATSYQMPVGEFHTGLADCYQKLNRIDQAIVEYQRAIQLKPQLAKAHNGLGACYQKQGKLDLALQSFQTATQEDFPAGRYNLASILLTAGNYQKAEEHFRKLLEEHPEFSYTARRLAWILSTAPNAHLRDGEQAKDLLEAHYDPEITQTSYYWDTRAAVQAELGEFNEAIQMAEKAIQVAKQSENKKHAKAINRRLQQYMAGMPWREGRAE